LQEFGECIQSSQIGPHLVQPLSISPSVTTLNTSAKRLNMATRSRNALIIRPQVRHFQAGPAANRFRPDYSIITAQTGKERPFMQPAEFDIAEARRVLGDVFAPWVQDLGLSVSGIEFAPPAGAAADWQPGAILRMAFSERLCRHGGIVCGQALMALADTAMVIAILAANRGYRPMTTVDQTTHFMRAATASDVIADARVVRLGRTMSFGRVTLSSAADNKPVAMVTSAFAML
jgi:uncharacterized protein (TIGR00369 family)